MKLNEKHFNQSTLNKTFIFYEHFEVYKQRIWQRIRLVYKMHTWD